MRFAGAVNDCHVLLNWQVATEEHVIAYTVERSTDGRAFQPVDTVAAVSKFLAGE